MYHVTLPEKQKFQQKGLLQSNLNFVLAEARKKNLSGFAKDVEMAYVTKILLCLISHLQIGIGVAEYILHSGTFRWQCASCMAWADHWCE